MSQAHPLNFKFRAVRSVGARAHLAVGAGPPSLFDGASVFGLWYHVLTSSFGWEGCWVGAVAWWRGPIFMRLSSAFMHQFESLFLIFVGQSGLIHHRLNP
jgi:hypothetical protein